MQDVAQSKIEIELRKKTGIKTTVGKGGGRQVFRQGFSKRFYSDIIFLKQMIIILFFRHILEFAVQLCFFVPCDHFLERAHFDIIFKFLFAYEALENKINFYQLLCLLVSIQLQLRLFHELRKIILLLWRMLAIVMKYSSDGNDVHLVQFCSCLTKQSNHFFYAARMNCPFCSVNYQCN